jgi:hypothetical protein
MYVCVCFSFDGENGLLDLCFECIFVFSYGFFFFLVSLIVGFGLGPSLSPNQFVEIL